MKNKIGVFLARMQPLHKAHLAVVEKMLQECERVVIVLGSSNKSNMIRNPFTIETRKALLASAIGRENMDRITLFELPDWSTEGDISSVKEWGRYLYYNIVSRIQEKRFTFYYSDEPAIMINWFSETEVEPYVSFNFMERSNMFDGLSATKIRNAFTENDIEYIKKYCPQSVVDNYEMLRTIWLDVITHPDQDFSMQ